MDKKTITIVSLGLLAFVTILAMIFSTKVRATFYEITGHDCNVIDVLDDGSNVYMCK